MPPDRVTTPSYAGRLTAWSPTLIACTAGGLMAASLWVSSRPDISSAGSARQLVASAADKIEAFEPLEAPQGLDPVVVRLGERLFHDPVLSRNQTVSCATCHDLEHGGDDGLPVSIGVGGRLGDVNAPTVLNASLHSAQFWDGRAPTLDAQIDGPIHNPNEMDSNWEWIVDRLAGDASYRLAFEEAFDAPPSPERVKRAIVAFETSLITVDAPFDRWLRGDRLALSAAALEGFQLYEDHGCASCHQGRAFGGNLFQRLGLMRDYFGRDRPIAQADLGRFNHTGNDEDKHVFRVPSLRNVELTGPYFHDGSAATLSDAVRAMLRFQVGVDPDEPEVTRLVEFLRSLTGFIEK